MQRQIRELTAEVSALKEHLRAMRESSSWRMSAPLRWLSGWLNGRAPPTSEPPAGTRRSYLEWVLRFDTELSRAIPGVALSRADPSPARPLFSIFAEAKKASVGALEVTLDSLRAQRFTQWELIVEVDPDDEDVVRSQVPGPDLASRQVRVVVGPCDTYDTTEVARGDWLLWLEPGDALALAALDHFVLDIGEHPEAKLIYADDDILDSKGQRGEPRFKPDWNPDLFHAQDLLSPALFARALIAEAGGRHGGAAASYDLELRCIERLRPGQIRHIPRVLCHRTKRSNDVDQAGAEAQALKEHFERTNTVAEVQVTDFGRRVRYLLPDQLPLVSLIIPTRNGLALLHQCVSSIVGRTTYAHYEILVVDNGSNDPETLAYLAELEKQPGFMVIRDDRLFNFSALNNLAARSARGEILGLINNDIEVITPDWLEELVSLALQPGVGAVGAKLLYPDESIQHGGVLLGVAGLAGHANKFLPATGPGYMNRAMLTQSFSAVTAACLVVRKALYEQVGGLNEVDLKIAYNDVDFCLRLREAGYRNVWTPYAELFHHESATRGSDFSPAKRQRFDQEQEYMRSRWAKLIADDPAYNPNLTLYAEDFGLAWPPRVPWSSGAGK